MNLYDILDVSPNDSLDDIKKSYKSLIKIYHPDKKNGDSEKYKQIITAYEILSDTKKRKEYDAMNNINKKKLLEFLLNILRIFVYNHGDISSIIDYFYNRQEKYNHENYVSDFESVKFREVNKNNYDINHKIYMHLCDCYNKKYYKFDYKTNFGYDTVIIPVSDDEFIFPNKGDKIDEDKRGDLIVKIEFISDDKYEILDNDLCVDIELNIFEYIYGCNKNIIYPNGLIEKVNFESFLHRSSIHILKNKGLFKTNLEYEDYLNKIKFYRGDIFLKIKVKDIDTNNLKNYNKMKKLLHNII